MAISLIVVFSRFEKRYSDRFGDLPAFTRNVDGVFVEFAYRTDIGFDLDPT